MRNTHLALSPRLCGEARELGAGTARVEWTATDETRADDRGLVHGGFVFGVADHAAIMVHGRIVRDGSPAELEQELSSAYLGAQRGDG